MRRFILIVLLLTLTGCALPGAAAPEATPAPSATPTAAPTLTPTPASPLVMLVLPADLNRAESDKYQTTVYELAQSAAYRFQVRNSFTPADLSEPGLSIVIVLPPDPGIASLAAAAPNIQFLAVNIAGVNAGGNVSTVGSADRPDYPAFIAGYIAAMISDDWRTGAMALKDDPSGAAALIAFDKGLSFFCGVCSPASPPYYDYPLLVEIPAQDLNNSAAYTSPMINYQAQAVYVAPEVQTDALVFALASSGKYVIGTRTPSDESLLSNWVVTIQPDYAASITTAWPSLVAGQGGQSFPSPLQFASPNEEIFTPGKQAFAQQMLQQMLDGFVFTGVNP